MNSARQTFRILALTVGLCVAWALVARVLPRPELAETNYEANRLRIERWLLDPPASHVLVGTSIGGRLLPTYFQGTGLSNFANLGLDGANPATGLELVLARSTAPEVVFLEIHRLAADLGANDQKLLEYARGFGLTATKLFPLTRAEYRPSSVLYGWLKSRQSGGAGGDPRPADSTNQPFAPGTQAPAWVGRIEPLVRAVEAKGSRVVLVRLPVGRENPANADASNFGDQAAAWLKVPLADLYRLTTKAGEPISYTDGLHLTPAGAATVAKWLARAAHSTNSVERGPL
ncbi:MAG TPA: hypothetical protein PLX89_24720 [Verrucomicrobiota bacterium]|nr:hypothetical protein [Verrucomicrobiales bacterium]HRI16213.1 hypothetical protein [Verrucomicrobiota bacterium]